MSLRLQVAPCSSSHGRSDTLSRRALLFSSRQSRRVTLTPTFALVERRRERKEKLKQRRSCTCSSSAGTPKVGSEKRYAASVTVDEEILLVSPTRLLLPEECTRIFGYPRAELMAEKYKLGKVVGAGSFGVVREAVKLSTGERVAVKTVSKMLKRIPKHLRRQGDRGTISKHLNKLQLEVDAMKCLRGSLNAVSLYDLYEGDEEVHLVMELCEGGTIYERITAQDFTEASAAGVARSILQMISQCHSKGVIYMDVKPENFLYLTNDTASVLKGTDFGLALKYTQGEKLATRRGTPVYMAPDVILKSYDPKVDCWSAGVLIFQLLHGRLPYADKLQGHSVREVWEMIINSDIDLSESTWKNFSSDSKDFISKLLQRDPESRLSAVDALKHPWLQEGAISTQDEKRPLQRSIIQRLQRFGTYSFLKQIVLSQIAEEASKLSDMSPHILDFFNSLDKDKNGTISYSELRQGLSKAGYLLADSEAQQLLSAIDTDGNGVLDLNEIFASLVDWNDLQKDENWPRWCKKMFEKLDMDRSGFIDLEELAKLVPSNMRGQRTVNALRMLREVDTNGDGKISYEEFMHMMNAEDEFLLVEFDSRLSQASFGDSTDLGSFDGSGDFGSI